MDDETLTPRAPSTRTMPVRASTEIGSDSPTPYLARRGLRANAYLDLARTLANYRLLALVLLLVDLSLVGAVVWQSHQTRIVPYVVQTDGYGNAIAFGPADQLADPDRALKVHELARWIRNVRTLSLDPEVQRQVILDAYAYTDRRAVAKLNDWYRSAPPFNRPEKTTLTVQVTSVLALSDAEKNWQLQWSETVRDPSGHLRHREHWQALVSLSIDPPDRVEEVVTNPLGLRVVDFDWTRLPSPETDTGDAP